MVRTFVIVFRARFFTFQRQLLLLFEEVLSRQKAMWVSLGI